jgi:hypothetical protein
VQGQRRDVWSGDVPLQLWALMSLNIACGLKQDD